MSGKGFDTRKLMTGKDGKLFITLDGVSIWFASVEVFTIGMKRRFPSGRRCTDIWSSRQC